VSLSVREARPEEYEELARIIVAANEQYAASFGENWPGYQEDLSDIAGRAARGTVLVGEVDGNLGGTVTYYPPHGDTDAGDWWWPADFAYLRALAVDPPARGRGLGRALTVAAIERATADGAAGIALHTSPVLAVAQRLYEQLGFRQTGRKAEWGGHTFLSYVLDLDRSVPSALLESEP
jgi:ribosomal protein S18 acetylase RimI-like enzyme